MKRVALGIAFGLLCFSAGGYFAWRARPVPPPKPAASSVPAPPKARSTPPSRSTTTPPLTPSAAAAERKRAPLAKRAAPPSAAASAASPVPDHDIATLTITSDVAGAQVFIDREFVGATPLVARGIKPGSHRINVSADGYEGYAENIDLAAGARDLVVNFKTVKLNAAIAVVHKHRFGSCKGRLVATPDGLRYETDDKDDAFRVTLADLQTFQVDYLDKNLRIQPRKGKTYNFTDPDGNADKLFVFHRDVEKIRKK